MNEMIPVADSHNDLLLGVHHQMERGHSDPFGDFWLPELRSGGIVVQVLPVFTEDQFVGEAALRRCLLILECAHKMAAVHSEDVTIVETSNQLRETIDAGKIALVLALEGAEPLGASVEMFDVFWRAGVRMLSLTWNRRTAFADGAGEGHTEGGLTTVGLEAVAEMERLGMILDVSHLSNAGFDHVAGVAKRPFVASHSSCYSLQSHPRNLTDDRIRLTAQSGGFVGLNTFGAFLSDSPTIASFLEHIDHAVKLVGPDHVGLGSDFIDDLLQIVDPILGGALVDLDDLPLVDGLRRPSDLAPLARMLVEKFGPHAGRSIAGGSIIRVLERLLPD